MSNANRCFKFYIIYIIFFSIQPRQGVEPQEANNTNTNATNSNATDLPTMAPKLNVRSEETDEINMEWSALKNINWLHTYIRGLTKRFPKTTKLVDIGKSKGGIPLYAVEIVQSVYTGGSVVIDAGMDCTDRIGINFAIFVVHQLIEQLSDNLSTLAGLKFVVVPLVNPDNYKNSLDGLNHEPCRGTFSQNFDVGNPPKLPQCPPGFFTEPETKALSSYYGTIKNIKLYLNVHSGSPTLAYPYGYKRSISEKSASMASNMRHVVNSKNMGDKVTVSNLNTLFGEYSGAPVDWMHEKLYVPYALYVALDRGSAQKAKMLEHYFEAFKYAVLQVQLTDPDVSIAIYNECNNSEIIHTNSIILILFFITIYW